MHLYQVVKFVATTGKNMTEMAHSCGRNRNNRRTVF